MNDRICMRGGVCMSRRDTAGELNCLHEVLEDCCFKLAT